jgi:hypothetical protein
MSIKVFFTAILASLLFVSCSETNTDYESNSSNAASTNEWKTYEVEIEAETNKSADKSTTTKAEIPFKITEENIGGKAILYPKLNITQESMPSLVVLYNKANGAKEIIEADWRVDKSDAEIKFILNKMTLKSDLSNGEWYIMSFMGGQKNGDKLTVNTRTTLNLIEKDQEFTTTCPFATTWRRIVKSGDKLKLSNESKKMVFKPQGVFLVLSLESRMTLPTKLNRSITMESNAFCSSGEYIFNINGNDVADDNDKAASYWEPNNQKAVAGLSNVYEKYNAKQYTTNITLKYDAAKDDGTLRGGQSDLNSYIYFNKYDKSMGTNTPNTKTSRGFLLCLMPVDYKKTSDYVGIVNETMFYGDLEVTDPNRTNFTYDANTYQQSPDTWRPYMGHRYILGSFSNELAKGSCYNMLMRIVRPTLPMERIWAYRQGGSLQKKQRTEAESIAEGTRADNNYPFLNSKLYRLPKYSEFVPIFNNPKLQLEKNEPIGGLRPSFIGTGYGNALTQDSHRDFVDINGVQRKFSNWFCSEKNSRVLYGIMYMKPFGGDANPTNNYKVAVRMTFPSPQASSGEATVETYYLGPNYNLSFNVAGYFICHPDFWKRLNPQEIIVRKFKLDTYWFNDKDLIDRTHETKSAFGSFNLSGFSQAPMTSYRRTTAYYFLPWLKKAAW